MQRLAQVWREGAFELLVCTELLEEFVDVTRRPHLAPLFDGEGLEFAADLLEAGLVVSLVPPYPGAPDPDDAYLFALLRDGEGDVLVTGDKALLALGTFEGKPTVSAADFLKLANKATSTSKTSLRADG